MTMRSADFVGILGAGGALKELKATQAALAEAGVGWDMATAGKLTRPMRRLLTLRLELEGAKRVPGAMIGQLCKQRLLDGAAGALGMIGSSVNGVSHEIAVWITEETNGNPIHNDPAG